MSIEPSEQALTAYLSLLQNKGASRRDLNQRKHFLRHVLARLRDKEKSGEVYRLVVDEVLANFPEQDELRHLPQCARDFYYFWLGDVRQIAQLNASGALDPHALQINVSGRLPDLLEHMDQCGWEDHPIPALNRYLQVLQQQGCQEAALDIRERLVRLLMFSIREHPPSARVYRAGVDALQQLFSKEDARQTFVRVAREFFYYWNVAPQTLEEKVGS